MKIEAIQKIRYTNVDGEIKTCKRGDIIEDAKEHVCKALINHKFAKKVNEPKPSIKDSTDKSDKKETMTKMQDAGKCKTK